MAAPETCEVCTGPVSYVRIRDDEAEHGYRSVELSPRAAVLIERRLDSVTEIESELGSYPIWSHKMWDPVIGATKAAELFTLVKALISAAQRVSSPENACSACEGPVERLFDAEGRDKGLYPTRRPQELIEAVGAAGAFRAAWTDEFKASEDQQANLEHYGDGRPLEEQLDFAEVPVLSEHWLYLAFGKEEGRSVLYPLTNLASAAGVPTDVLMEHL